VYVSGLVGQRARTPPGAVDGPDTLTARSPGGGGFRLGQRSARVRRRPVPIKATVDDGHRSETSGGRGCSASLQRRRDTVDLVLGRPVGQGARRNT
jgi:hypothetical protein